MDAMYDRNKYIIFKVFITEFHYRYMDKSLNWSINKIIVLSVMYSNHFIQITNKQKLLLSFPHSFSSLLPLFISFCSTSATLLLGNVRVLHTNQ